jgi:hypothetical protein
MIFPWTGLYWLHFRDPYGDEERLLERDAWLIDHVGRGNFRMRYEDTAFNGEVECHLGFKKSGDRVMFKLRWGGT